MLQIFTKIPLFVLPLFIVLLIGGMKARKTGQVPLVVLLLIPSCFFTWSLFSFFGKYAFNPLAIFCWLICLSVGFFIGFTHTMRLKLRFDKKKRLVEIPGSLVPLILSMSMFCSKFSIGMISSIMPHLQNSFLVLSLDLFSTIILGIFAGRGIGCLIRYRSSNIDIPENQS